ncbi:hypothetical protein MFUL124B02_17665 [Myxococcus fulvus 124B02]|nr:hypothetical protein MFUL124B02_17665 [Myxococcus fulvus 124B02]
MLCLELERRGLPQVSVATMGRALTWLGARCKAARPIVECPWPAWKRRRRLYELKCLHAHKPPEEPVLHVDEVDIHLNPKVGHDGCLPGQRRVVVTPGNNQKRFLAGALRFSAKPASSSLLGEARAGPFCAAASRASHSRRRDSAAFHRASNSPATKRLSGCNGPG